MKTLSEENQEAVIAHLHNYPLNQFDHDFDSLNFSEESSNFASEPENQIIQKNQEQEKVKDTSADPIDDKFPFAELNKDQNILNILRKRPQSARIIKTEPSPDHLAVSPDVS